MNKLIRLVLMIMICGAICVTCRLDVANYEDGLRGTSAAKISAQKTQKWNAYVEAAAKEPSLQETSESGASITLDGVNFKYGMRVKGSEGENGYPVYICLHGGGATSINESQWKDMYVYYYKSITSGILVNTRALEDTWDCHWRPNSFVMYDSIIENLKAHEGSLGFKVDLNRVYLLGYSAGGDGVYRISPVMADRFAAMNMSAGHPNGVEMQNMYNLPILLQVGELDTSYDRNKIVAKYAEKLDDYATSYGGGFVHDAYIHKDKEHSYVDDNDKFSGDDSVIADPVKWMNAGYTGATYKTVDANAVRWVDKYVRNPLPQKVVWNLAVRQAERRPQSFYWLSADDSVDEGIVVASYSRADNSVTIESNTANGEVSILLNEKMLDFGKKITVRLPSGERRKVTPKIDKAVLAETTLERGDPDFQFLMKLSLAELAK